MPKEICKIVKIEIVLRTAFFEQRHYSNAVVNKKGYVNSKQ